MSNFTNETKGEEVTPEEVTEWFRAASPIENQPTAFAVEMLVRTINQIRGYSDRELRIIDPTSPLTTLTDLDALDRTTDTDLAHELQAPLRKLHQLVPPLIEVYENNDLDALVVHRLKQLRTAVDELFQDAAYLFEQSKRGGKDRPWHVQLHLLLPFVEQALKSCGRTRIGKKPDSPLVKILVRALKVFTGRIISGHTISSELKRAKRTGKRSLATNRNRPIKATPKRKTYKRPVKATLRRSH